jgi:predicted membrane channel-forming protein YqfA (hemolysin III family)
MFNMLYETCRDFNWRLLFRGTVSKMTAGGNFPLKLRTTYSDGTTRPLLRGVLHGVIAVAFVAGTLSCSGALLTGELESQWWRFLLLLVGKLTSYVSSSLFHLFPTERPEMEAAFLRSDLVTISIAIWAPSGAFAMDIVEWSVLLAIMVCVTSLNFVLVQRQFGTPPKSPLARSILLLLYFVFNVLQIGWHYGYRGLWIAGVVCYLGGFLLGPPLHHSFRPAFWHAPAFNSWHEDFHLLLGVADVFFLAIAIEFLTDPGVVKHFEIRNC